MSDLTEQQLHAAFATKLTTVPASAVQRVCATDYHPKRYRLALVPMLTAAMTALAAFVVALVFLPSGTTSAFAGWTARPTALTAAALTKARTVCGDVAAGGVRASEARGPFVALVYVRHSSPWECVSNGPKILLNQTTPEPPSAFADPGRRKVTLPVISARAVYGAAKKQEDLVRKRWLELDHEELVLTRRGTKKLTQSAQRRFARAERSLAKQFGAAITGPESLTAVSGAVGANVTGVALVLADGKRVAATVRNDWYLAWWPGTASHNAYPVSVQITTPAGTRTADFSRTKLREQFIGCVVNERCYMPRIRLRQGIAPELKQNFDVFRATPPASGELLRELEPGAWSVGIGADIPQLRAVSFGRRGTVIAIPGTGGVCVEVARFDTDRSGLLNADLLAAEGRANGFGGDGGLCAPATNGKSQNPFIAGAFSTSYRRSASGRAGTYTLMGIVPDGNPTVTVNVKSGRAETIRVNHNIVFYTLTEPPAAPTVKATPFSGITYRNAAGRTVHLRLG